MRNNHIQNLIKTLTFTRIIAMGVLTLSGCFVKGILPLPKPIHDVQKSLELETAGEVGPVIMIMNSMMEHSQNLTLKLA